MSRFLLLLPLFILLACGPAEGYTAQDLLPLSSDSPKVTVTPISTPIPDPRVAQLQADVAELRVAIDAMTVMSLEPNPLSQDECIETLQQYYSSEQWKNLGDGGFLRKRTHAGEWACKDEQFYQDLPMQVRLIMYQVNVNRSFQGIDKVKQSLGDKASYNHSHYNNYP